jgi:hypothetical protein
LAESHLVSPQNPCYECRSEAVECHEGAVDCPLAVRNSAVSGRRLAGELGVACGHLQNDETWYTLEGDKTGSCQLPGIVARVQPGCGRIVGCGSRRHFANWRSKLCVCCFLANSSRGRVVWSPSRGRRARGGI